MCDEYFYFFTKKTIKFRNFFADIVVINIAINASKWFEGFQLIDYF